jgi:hypothetical protein
VAIRSAIVTIEDPVDPLISEASGELVGGGWLNGTMGVSFEGSDVTGIRQVGVYRGSSPVVVRTAGGAAAGGCGQLNQGVAYTFTKPCEGGRGVNGPQVLEVDTRLVPDGTGDLRLVVRDAAGNEAERVVEVQVDNAAPRAPVVTTGGEWSSQSSGTWVVEAAPELEDRAPIGGGEVELCGPLGCVIEALGPGATELSASLAEGISTVRVRLEDSAGNVGSWSEPVPSRRDRTPPVVRVMTPGETVVEGQAVEAQVEASDALSGVSEIEREVRVNGGAWRALDGPEAFGAGSVVEFRARARDAAGNVSGWVDSDEVRVVRASTGEPRATPPPTAAPAPALTPVPTAIPRPDRKAVAIVGLKARYRRGVVTISGRLRPGAATGDVRVLRVRARVKGGRFVVRLRTRRPPRRVAIRYSGDARFRPAQRKVAVRRTGQA